MRHSLSRERHHLENLRPLPHSGSSEFRILKDERLGFIDFNEQSLSLNSLTERRGPLKLLFQCDILFCVPYLILMPRASNPKSHLLNFYLRLYSNLSFITFQCEQNQVLTSRTNCFFFTSSLWLLPFLFSNNVKCANCVYLEVRMYAFSYRINYYPYCPLVFLSS